MNKDIGKYGNTFSKDNQPPNESKRVPKWKTRIKKALKENMDDVIEAQVEQWKKGDLRHLQFIKEWLYGKDKEQIEQSGKIKIDIDYV